MNQDQEQIFLLETIQAEESIKVLTAWCVHFFSLLQNSRANFNTDLFWRAVADVFQRLEQVNNKTLS